jgi:hypothetical protein
MVVHMARLPRTQAVIRGSELAKKMMDLVMLVIGFVFFVASVGLVMLFSRLVEA